MKKKEPEGFFDKQEPWKKEWKGMPEFIQDDRTPLQSILVHFNNEKDRDKFSELIKQKLTSKTKSIYYPKARRANLLKKRCSDES